MKPISQKALKWSNAAALALILAISQSLIGVRPAAADDVPSATIEFAGGSVAAGVGYTWGKGTLVYQGSNTPYRLRDFPSFMLASRVMQHRERYTI